MDSDRVALARILLELGELAAAQAEIVEILAARPDDLEALDLYGKLGHVRGELSHAIACFALFQARAPYAERVRAALAALYRRASEPESAPSVAIGSTVAAGFDAEAEAEIELAFRLSVGGRNDAAVAACEALAARRRDDREAYKLAVLASAFVAEIGGLHDLVVARLEALGCERGFEDDVERLLALARAYERLGTREALESAARLCAHLEARFERLPMASRLAALHRRLGDVARARGHEARGVEAFRRRMHLPSADEVVRVAARRRLPLARLRQVRVSAAATREDLGERERAVRDVLDGSLERAREAFSRGGTPLDREYRAEVAHLEGDLDAAARDYLALARSESAGAHVFGWLLDHGARAPALTSELASEIASEVDALLRDPAVAARARAVIEGALRADPSAPSAWRWRAALLSRDPYADEARVRAALDHADAVAEAHARATNPIGRVLAAGVYRVEGDTMGLVHQLWAEREATAPGLGGALSPESILGNVTDEMRRGVRNVFLAAREWARARFPQRTRDVLDFHYAFKVTKDDEPSGGLSAGLPTALAFLSVFLQRPVPSRLASTGVVVSDAHDVVQVRPVGDVEFKVRGAYHANVRTLLLPAANRGALAESALVPAAIRDEIVRFVATLDEAAALVFGEDCFTID